MAKNTSIVLEEHFDWFINQQIETGRFSSASEVVETALRFFEEENKKYELNLVLEKGEKSGFVEDFNPDIFLRNLHNKYVSNEI
ncbi:antitoxin ParD1/3/4 [Pedobacter sp. UYP30]|uniref:type II toxin-antitoxin system ParD family antitoxin n=1 Tax=Pedobacter sp. UYP30 TaxID=1756400 RepID=UPI0033991F4D